MNLGDLQSIIYGLIIAIPMIAPAAAHVVLDDGQQDKVMEKSLKDEGLSILILQPISGAVFDEVKTSVVVEYEIGVLIRTNPKVLNGQSAKWNPVAVEAAIIPVVIQPIGAGRSYFKFKGSTHIPEDLGNNSRSIHFQPPVKFA